MNVGQSTHFSTSIEKYENNIAILDENQKRVTYSDLAKAADWMAEKMGPKNSLVLIRCGFSINSVVAYLACLRHQKVAMLLDANISSPLEGKIVARYRPETVVDVDGQVRRLNSGCFPLRDDLALLMSTSGTTGSPKMVMLSRENLQANAFSICQFLPIGADDRSVTTLPFHYSYGLSVLNSHLLVGAGISITPESIISRAFWHRFEKEEITSFAGVPFTYEMLKRLRFNEMTLPSLKYFTQAGGKLPVDTVVYFAKSAEQRQIDFFVMYGQTEATARISYMPPGKLLSHPSYIGTVIPGGALRIRQADDDSFIDEPGKIGELVYQGPNVMLGYAEDRQGLYGVDRLVELNTGDLGRRNNDGLFQIVGRLKRFIKIYGQRINLDELEQLLRLDGHDVMCGGTDQNLILGCLDGTPDTILKYWVNEKLMLHPGVVKVLHFSERPLASSGKTDYAALLKGGL